MTDFDVGVAILAGGKSRRMGMPKCDIVIPGDGRTLLNRICDEMSFFDHRYLSLRKEQPCNRSDYQRIDDLYEDIGPMGALYALLSSAGTDALLVLACDMPAYMKEHALKMLENYQGENILIPKTVGGYEPLAAIYSKQVLPLIRQKIGERCFRLVSLMEMTDRVKVMNEEDAGPFKNVNEKEDLSI